MQLIKLGIKKEQFYLIQQEQRKRNKSEMLVFFTHFLNK